MIYLDHTATTRPAAAVLAHYAAQMDTLFANPASLHRLGLAAEKSLATSRQTLARLFQCRADEVILTSGGTESINTAIKGFVEHNPRLGQKIITTAGEHAATRETLAWLAGRGYLIHTVPLLANGQLDLADLANAIDDQTALITLLHVNNETGAVNPLHEVARLRNLLRPQAAIHVDAVQTPGKRPLAFCDWGIDLLSGSGHKFAAPKGIGWLIQRQGIRLAPLLHGGGQQKNRRSGTENAALAAALAQAAELASDKLAAGCDAVATLRDTLLTALQARQIDFRLLSPPDAVPHILNLAFPGLRGETMLHALESQEIYVSTGSACSSHKKGPSPVLLAMGVSRSVAECSIRISLAPGNSAAEMEATAEAIAGNLRWLRR